MELQLYIDVFRRRQWTIVGATIVGIALAALLSYFATPIYRSSTTLRVATFGGGIAGQYPNIVYSERLMNTYSSIVTGGQTRDEIVTRLGLSSAPDISVEIIPNTELLRISAEATEPQIAQDTVAEAAKLLIAESRNLYIGSGQTTLDILRQQLDQAESGLAQLRNEYATLLNSEDPESARVAAAINAIELSERTYAGLLDQYETIRLNEAFIENAISVVEPAWLPTYPAKPRIPLNLALGMVVGVMAGVVLGLLRDNLDTRLYTARQIETVTQMRSMGQIPKSSGILGLVGVNSSAGNLRPQTEAFRRLRINLLSFVPEGQPYVLLVTSAKEDEGKSTVAANLAVAIAKSGRRVAVVDCNIYKPKIHDLFNMSNRHGLTNVLTGQVTLQGALQDSMLADLQVVTNGEAILESAAVHEFFELPSTTYSDRLRLGSELLGSTQMRELLLELKSQYDIVILDTPALASVTDAAVLTPLVDHVLLVVAQAYADRESVGQVCDQLGVMNVKSISTVVNRVRQ